jgi:hypothetical protein
MNNSVSIPFRILTPSQFVICLILFFLPWVEIQCPMPKDLDFKNPNAKLDTKNFDWTPLVRQSGFQAATGNYSLVDPGLQKMMDQAPTKDKKDDKTPAAPLLWLFLLAIVSGIVIGFVVPSSPIKKGILIVCCILALGTAGIQAAIGFPITNQSKDQMKNSGGKKNDLQMGMGLGDMEMIKTTLKFPFYLTLLFCIGAVVTSVLESAPKPRKKKRIVEEEEDSDEEPRERTSDW